MRSWRWTKVVTGWQEKHRVDKPKNSSRSRGKPPEHVPVHSAVAPGEMSEKRLSGINNDYGHFLDC